MEIQIDDEPGQGTLERGRAGDYELSLGGLLSEAWSRIDGNKGTIWKAILIYSVLAFLISFFFALLDGSPPQTDTLQPPTVIEMIGNIVSSLILMPMGVGLCFVATAIAMGRTPNPKSLFGWYDNTLKIFLTAILMNLLIGLGILLFILPGIYLAVSYQIALPLMVDKKLGPWEALETSRKVIGHKWFLVLSFDIIAMAVLVLSTILMGIPLIWTLPAILIAYGILYRTMVGLEPVTLDRVLAE